MSDSLYCDAFYDEARLGLYRKTGLAVFNRPLEAHGKVLVGIVEDSLKKKRMLDMAVERLVDVAEFKRGGKHFTQDEREEAFKTIHAELFGEAEKCLDEVWSREKATELFSDD